MYSIDIQSPEFVKCLERGEREAFQRLFEMYHKALCFFAARMCGIVWRQKTLCRMFFSLLENGSGGLPNLKTVKTFLYNSVQHRCLELSSGFGDSGPELSKSENGKSWMKTIFFVSRSGQKWWRNFLRQLTSYRINARKSLSVLTWMAKEEQKIAEELDISLNTIKTQKQRAKSPFTGKIRGFVRLCRDVFPGL